MNTTEKYYWLMSHPQFIVSGSDSMELDISPHMVHPKYRRIMDYDKLNTHMELWCEVYGTSPDDDPDHPGQRYHDWELDCGGDTWNEVIDKLYQLVLNKYGDYTELDVEMKYKQVYPTIGKSSVFDKLFENNIPAMVRRAESKVDEFYLMTYERDIIECSDNLNALLEYKPNADPEEIDEIDKMISKYEMNLYLIEMSKKFGYDLR